MNNDKERGRTSPLQGQILRRNERREVAIFLLDDALWVADFIDGKGEIVDAVTWFRYNCAGTSVTHAERRMLLESALPLSSDLTARIESLLRLGNSKGGASDIDAPR
jgi:hypothetical protein